MSKYLSIQIPTSCHEDWENMTKVKQGRYCNSCEKTVIDFTGMSDTQLVNFFSSKKAENVCGQFYNDQLNTAIVIPKKTIPWLKYFFTITLPAFLFSQKSNGQNRKQEVIQLNNFKKLATQNINEKDSFKLLDEVIVRNQHYTRGRTLGMVYTTLSCKVGGRTIISQNEIKNKIQNEITIYPNPIVSNTTMNISWKNIVNASQYVEIFDANGNLLQKEMIAINSKLQQSKFWLKKMAAGFYIIRITDTKTLQKMSKEFIVL
jgi:Secretion system C-terminal sorting domain